MSLVVVDSGILIAAVYPESFTPQAKRLLKRFKRARTVLHAPSLLRYELVAVSRKAVYQGRVTPQEGRAAVDQLLRYPVFLHFDDLLLKRAYELAEEFNRPTAYDAQYLALTERLACEFWTVDERLYNATHAKVPQIRWLGSLANE